MRKNQDCFLISSFLVFAILACRAQATPVIVMSPFSPTNTSQPVTIQVNTEVPITAQLISCDDWQSLPVVPIVSRTVRELYERGQAGGNDPHAFSKIGDGEIAAAWFFTAFDLDEDYYDLGPYQNLLQVIEHFAGSFERIGMAARRGFNTDLILDPSASDSPLCEFAESPIDCDLRLHQPAFAILSLGTNQVWQRAEFDRGMRQILNGLISKNVVPILSTKGDNLEGDHSINRTIACLAQEYDVPLWNFWSAIQLLPNHGLQADLEHLTYGINDFDDAHAMQSAWTLRNLTALQALDAVWRAVTVQP
jgi:hypothetical protein